MTRLPGWAHRGRGGWRYTGAGRPPFAMEPAAGQESVWDYPRPPRLEPDGREVVVQAHGQEVARSTRSVRVLETASPPTFYVPPDDVNLELLEPGSGRSRCEWKGEATYWQLVGSLNPEPIAWSYTDPFSEFAALQDYLAFYPGRVDCFVATVRVRPQPGFFYGGWITPDVVGPFKGKPGSEGW